MQIMDGRKVAPELDNPIDNVLIALANEIKEPLHNYGVTPNKVTTFSIAFAIIAAALVAKSRFYSAATFFALAYLMDRLDGHMARSYNEESQFGTVYGDVSNIVRSSALGIAVSRNAGLDSTSKAIFTVLVTILAFVSTWHSDCQDRVYSYTTSVQVRENNKCSNPRYIHLTRFFGKGTVATTVFASLLLFGFRNQ